MKPGNKWCTRCQHEHIPEMPTATYACADCGFGSWSVEIAEDHGRSLAHHTVILRIHNLVDAEPRLQRIKDPGSKKRAHLTHNGVTPICGTALSDRRMPATDDIPLCGHCKKLEP